MNPKCMIFAMIACVTACESPTEQQQLPQQESGLLDTGEYVEPPPPPFAPATGDWTIQTRVATHDPCSISTQLDRGQPGDKYLVSNTEELGFDIQYGNDSETGTGGEIQTCLIDEETLSFTCQEIQYGIDLKQSHNLNAEIKVQLGANGSFADPNAMELTNDTVLDCIGADCWLVEISFKATLPCEYTTLVESNADSPIADSAD